MTDKAPDELPEGAAKIAVEVRSVATLSDAFRAYERYNVAIARPDGVQVAFDREILRSGDVVGVLTLDLSRRELVLIRQFRLASHLAMGLGELVELVAGRVDPGETSRQAAIRECEEEIGIAPVRIARVLTFLPAAAFSDELMSLWIAEVDAAAVPDFAGEESEDEFIRPFRISIGDAYAALARNAWRSAPLVIGLQWLQLNESRLADMFVSAAETSDG